MPSHKRFAMDVLQTLRIKIDSRVIEAYLKSDVCKKTNSVSCPFLASRCFKKFLN